MDPVDDSGLAVKCENTASSDEATSQDQTEEDLPNIEALTTNGENIVASNMAESVSSSIHDNQTKTENSKNTLVKNEDSSFKTEEAKDNKSFGDAGIACGKNTEGGKEREDNTKSTLESTEEKVTNDEVATSKDLKVMGHFSVASGNDSSSTIVSDLNTAEAKTVGKSPKQKNIKENDETKNDNETSSDALVKVVPDENANFTTKSNFSALENHVQEQSIPTECSSQSTSYVYDEKLKEQEENRQGLILEPLLLQNNNNVLLIQVDSTEIKFSDNETPCMLCNYTEVDVDVKTNYDEYLCHLIVEHKLVIADVKLIADLRSYALYWRKRFAEESVKDFCSTIRTNSGSKDICESELFFLLCDALPEDKKVREELQLAKLKKLLLRQEFERKDDGFERMCPFCTKYFKGNRILLFNHMTEDHNFNIGHPDNIVNVREFLDEIQQMLDALQCLFCEKLFKDRASLREHMRKKAHRRLNPKNKSYDKYYIINYLELGKNWETLQGESERLDPNEDWSGWYEASQTCVCFFCPESFEHSEDAYQHMKDQHRFDFVAMRQEMQMSFYQQIKLINYIRRQARILRVISEDDDNNNELAGSVLKMIQTSTDWNQPQYYFPTYEDDTLLCQLEDKDGLFEPEDTFVIGEDGMDCRSIVNDSVLTDLVVSGYFEVQ